MRNDIPLLFVFMQILFLNVSVGNIEYHGDYRGPVPSSLYQYILRINEPFPFYPRGIRLRKFVVPNNLISWHNNFTDYNPPNYTAKSTKNKAWSDPEIWNTQFKPKWNKIDGVANRTSCLGPYGVSSNYPLNPYGRTGMAGRGVLLRWGPNHYANLLFTRFKVRINMTTLLDLKTQKEIVQILLVRRFGSARWTLPGTLLNAGQDVRTTLKNSFLTDMVNIERFRRRRASINNTVVGLETLLENGEEIFKGFVDDPCNTDNAWVETTAIHIHDEDFLICRLPFGIPFVGFEVKWSDLRWQMGRLIYATDFELIKRVANKLDCHW